MSLSYLSVCSCQYSSCSVTAGRLVIAEKNVGCVRKTKEDGT